MIEIEPQRINEGTSFTMQSQWASLHDHIVGTCPPILMISILNPEFQRSFWFTDRFVTITSEKGYKISLLLNTYARDLKEYEDAGVVQPICTPLQQPVELKR